MDGMLAAVFALAGLALRLPLMGRGLWRDEGSTFAVVDAPTVHAMLGHVWTTEMTPPLYYFLEHLWIQLAGTAEATLRVPSLVFGVITIVVMYALGLRIGGRTAAVICAFCAAFAPLAIDLDTEARAYALAMLLSATFLLAYTQAMTAPRVRTGWLVLLAASGIFLTATFTTGFVVIGTTAALAVVHAFLHRTRENAVVAIVTVATGLASLVSLSYLAHYIHGWHGCCMPPGELGNRIESGLNAFSPFGIMFAQVDLAIEIGVVIWLVTLPLRRRDRIDTFIALAASIVALGILASGIEEATPGRHFMAYAPAAWLLMALLLLRFLQWAGRARSWKWIAAVPLAYGLFCGLIHYPSGYKTVATPLSDVRDAVEALAPFANHRLLVVAAPDYLGPTLNYYLRSTPGALLRGVGTWDDPQFYRFDPRPWDVHNFTRVEVDRIEQLARSDRALIVLVASPSAPTFDSVPFGRAVSVIAPLEATNRVLYKHVFPSTRETVDVAVLQPARIR